MTTRDWHRRKDIECGEWIEDGRGRDPIVISARSCMLRVGHEGPHKDEHSAASGVAFIGPYRVKAKVPESDVHLLTAGMVVNELVWTGGKKGVWTAEMQMGLPQTSDEAEMPASEWSSEWMGPWSEPAAPPPNDSGRPANAITLIVEREGSVFIWGMVGGACLTWIVILIVVAIR